VKRDWKKVEHQGELYITCEELVTFLFEYLDGEASSERAHEFEKHLAVCPPCVAYLKTYRQAIQLGRTAMREEEPESAAAKPAELAEDLVRAILSSRKGS
jgi:anti-sigma factor RsiW